MSEVPPSYTRPAWSRLLQWLSILLAGLLFVAMVVLAGWPWWQGAQVEHPLLTCGGWYGYDPATGKCDMGMPSGPPYPAPGIAQ